MAPPTTAITIKEAAFFVWGPKSLIPKAKRVGYMIDIKKKIAYNDIREIQPNCKLTIGKSTMQSAE